MTADRTITAYVKGRADDWVLEPASPAREWMDKTPHRFAYRCLPLVMANQAGWVIRIPGGVKAYWGGKDDPASTKVTFYSAPDHFTRCVNTNFGCGVVSFAFPWLFRTPPGIGLWVRGAPNQDLPNAFPCEGLVETDWATQSFTMNWRITAKHKTAQFPPGFPVCMLVPYPLDLPEDLDPVVRSIRDNPELAEEFQAFLERKKQINQAFVDKREAGEDYEASDWKLEYMKGTTSTGEKAERHRTNLKLRPFGPPAG